MNRKPIRKTKARLEAEKQQTELDRHRHVIGLLESLAKLHPGEFLKVAKKLEKQTV